MPICLFVFVLFSASSLVQSFWFLSDKIGRLKFVFTFKFQVCFLREKPFPRRRMFYSKGFLRLSLPLHITVTLFLLEAFKISRIWHIPLGMIIRSKSRSKLSILFFKYFLIDFDDPNNHASVRPLPTICSTFLLKSYRIIGFFNSNNLLFQFLFWFLKEYYKYYNTIYYTTFLWCDICFH